MRHSERYARTHACPSFLGYQLQATLVPGTGLLALWVGVPSAAMLRYTAVVAMASNENSTSRDEREGDLGLLRKSLAVVC